MMNCEHCGNHEATYHYRSTINGQHTEQHLCPDCARTMEGSVFTGALAGTGETETPFLGTPFWGGGFSAMNQMMASFLRPRGLAPSGAVQAAPAAPAKPQPRDAEIPATASQELLIQRERNALSRELEAAVKAERFERAAELRDALYRLEKREQTE